MKKIRINWVEFCVSAPGDDPLPFEGWSVGDTVPFAVVDFLDRPRYTDRLAGELVIRERRDLQGEGSSVVTVIKAMRS